MIKKERSDIMHHLHTILVPVENSPENYQTMSETEKNKIDKDDIISAREYAETETEHYYDTAYDWRETITAGRWSDEYSPNVILGRTSPERFRKELNRNKECLRDYIKELVDDITKKTDSDLDIIVQHIQTNKEKEPQERDSSVEYNFILLARYLYGEYFYNSPFYDAEYNTAELPDKRIKEIEANINNYALVFFDYHF